MVRRLLPLVLAPLAGCALTPPPMPPARPVTVDVPVAEAVYCSPPLLRYPDLPITKLTADSPPADTIRAYAATILVLKGVVRERETVIEGCVAPGPAQTATSSDSAAQAWPSRIAARRQSAQTQQSGAKRQ